MTLAAHRQCNPQPQQTPQMHRLLLPDDIRPPNPVTLNCFDSLPLWQLRSETPVMLPLRQAHAFPRIVNTMLVPKIARVLPVVQKRNGRGPAKGPWLSPRCPRCQDLGYSDEQARSCPASKPNYKKDCPRSVM